MPLIWFIYIYVLLFNFYYTIEEPSPLSTPPPFSSIPFLHTDVLTLRLFGIIEPDIYSTLYQNTSIFPFGIE